MRRFRFYIFILITTLLSSRSQALQLTFDLDSLSQIEETDLFANLGFRRFHPPIQIRSYNNGSGFVNMDLEMGTGVHGDFNLNTYHRFSKDGDLSGYIIRLDTEQFPILELTSFELLAGWTLQPIGNNPLIIKVHGETKILGVIDCSGEEGQDVQANLLTINLGGIGRCAGGNGGNGASLTTTAQNGLAGGDTVSGGVGGQSMAAADGVGGGGGGGYGDTNGGLGPESGTNSSMLEVFNEGLHFTEHDFTTLGGGSGGGGGKFYESASAFDSSGAGGGGGGGVVYIYSIGDLTIGSLGKVLANGGAGGGDSGLLRAGGGGGGAGGSIWIISAGTLTNEGLIQAIGGSGGSTFSPFGGEGGKGGAGRTWVTEKNVVPSGAGILDPISYLVSTGAVRFKTGEFSLVLKSLDLRNSKPNLEEVLLEGLVTDGGSLSLQYETSSQDNLQGSNWKSWSAGSSDPTILNRFLKLKVRLESIKSDEPTYLESLEIDYEPYSELDYEFAGGCGKVGIHSQNPSRKGIFIILLLLFLPLVNLILLRLTTPNLK